jgi:hypothetical protein
MVMDILDTLNHRTNFDEFIIFSGDSDFMPVLLRLRAFDRRTTTLAIDFMPPSYRAACDLVISEEDFIEEALGISHEGNCGGSNAGRARVSANVIKEMATRVYDAVCAVGEVDGANLPDILKDFRAFRESTNWLGFGTSQRLAEALVCSEQRLNLVRLNPTMYKIALKPPVIETVFVSDDSPAPAAKAVEEEKFTVMEKPAGERRLGRTGEKMGRSELLQLRVRIIQAVKELAAASAGPILLARASQHVVSKLGPQVLETQWAGAGSFKRLLQSSVGLGLEVTTQPEPGYLFDPARHVHPTSIRAAAVEDADLEMVEGLPDGNGHSADETIVDDRVFAAEDDGDDTDEAFSEPLPTLDEFARRVNQVTGAPDLSPVQYALVFHGIVQELHEIAEGRKTYSTYQSSKAVSDWCAEHGENIPRSDVVMIFKGIIFQDGVRFGKRPGSYSAIELAGVVRDNVKALCRRSRMELTEYEDHLLEEWIMGELEVEMLPEATTAEPEQRLMESGSEDPQPDQPAAETPLH